MFAHKHFPCFTLASDCATCKGAGECFRHVMGKRDPYYGSALGLVSGNFGHSGLSCDVCCIPALPLLTSHRFSQVSLIVRLQRSARDTRHISWSLTHVATLLRMSSWTSVLPLACELSSLRYCPSAKSLLWLAWPLGKHEQLPKDASQAIQMHMTYVRWASVLTSWLRAHQEGPQDTCRRAATIKRRRQY